MKTILILGASSGIAQSFSMLASRRGYKLILAGRDLDTLNYIARDIEIKNNIKITASVYFDALKTEDHSLFFKKVLSIEPDIYGCFISLGVMYDQKESENNFELCSQTILCNYLGLVSVINVMAKYFEEKGDGFISCITSVAGDRGRQSNYIYGSSKGAMDIYLQGLRNKLFKSKVLVQTVKPGPVDTKMTKGMDKLPFLASPDKVAKDILEAIENRKDIIYTPFIWRYIMKIISLIPEKIYKRLNL